MTKNEIKNEINKIYESFIEEENVSGIIKISKLLKKIEEDKHIRKKRYFSLRKYNDDCVKSGLEEDCNLIWAIKCDGKEVINGIIKIEGCPLTYYSRKEWEILK